MKRNFFGLVGFLIVVVIVVAYGSVFIVSQTEQAMVLQFGELKQVIRDPGLKFKLPFVQNVVFFDRRVLEFDPPVEEVISTDGKVLVVDAYTRYKIIDPLKYYQTVFNESNAKERLGVIVTAVVKRVIGTVTLAAVLSPQRAEIMQDISRQMNLETKELGIEVVDTRIRHADLPEGNSKKIYDRMTSEREREAKQYRAEGAEEAQRIRARADREKVVILAEARRQSQITRGEGEGESVRIYAEAFGKDPQFFALYRSLQAYRTALGGGDTTMVLSPDSEFFEYFNKLPGNIVP